VRIEGILGLAAVATALAIGGIHAHFTGDASVTRAVVGGVAFALLLAFLARIRAGAPLGWRIRAS
jgi:hypothetical protein